MGDTRVKRQANSTRVTRGRGLLEEVLARLRVRQADSLITSSLRGGCILDIGSGATPYFLRSIKFNKKYGIDKHDEFLNMYSGEGVVLRKWDFSLQNWLPFDDGSMDVVTMLAVFEHVEPDLIPKLISEVRRVLKQKGVYILTVPAGWTDPILKLMSTCGILSALEIYDHKDLYNREKLIDLLDKGGFTRSGIESGYFEMGMNIWVRAKKV